MTTKVTVEACCSSDKSVSILISDERDNIERIILKDGESTDVYVYDDRVVHVREIESI